MNNKLKKNKRSENLKSSISSRNSYERTIANIKVLKLDWPNTLVSEKQ